MIVQISAGQGPSECQLAVSKLFVALKREYEDLEVISETKGYEKGCLDSIRFRTAQDLSSLEGTVLWISRSIPSKPQAKELVCGCEHHPGAGRDRVRERIPY